MAAVVESSCRVELLVSLQSSDGLVEVEVEDDEAGEGLESVSRREALDRLDRETFESRRRAAKARRRASTSPDLLATTIGSCSRSL